MAISLGHYRLMVRHRDILPRGGDVLQIGDANWYGDSDPLLPLELTDDPELQSVVRRAAESGSLHRIAKAFYAALFAPKSITSVDINGSEGCLRLDLNAPLHLAHQFDLSVNHGTAEHVFHIAQVFGTMHAWTKPGGLMIHEAPFFGWPDHGFYTLQPTLFYDLAAANGYEIVSVSIFDLKMEQEYPAAASKMLEQAFYFHARDRREMHRLIMERKIPDNAILFVVMRKGAEAPFRIPMQGVYDGTLSDDGRKAWQEAR